MNQVYIGLGTNIEPRESYLKKAIHQLFQHDAINITKQSSIYETEPVGFTEQSHFLNMVLEINTSLTPLALLDVCQGIESHLGRERVIRFGPRTIDLDILLYNNENMKTERLTIPHPRMHERGFVLIPLAEIAPNAILPPFGTTSKELLNKLPEAEKKGIVKYFCDK